ncbi:catenin delta-2-like isoform X14 [Penaeus chinensis]|uniref:catenin delta-2-like isoform X14 n=1 Tax=Penaeus chinensis TaxID=139456 RepID=UPI001FB57C65|nr:catenin delta-2-like isoform X14 [Penaeus chinensis]
MTDTFGEPEVTTTTTTYSVDYGPQTTNGHLQDSPDTSRLSVSSASQDGTQLVSRKQTHHTTQQITTTTKVIRELHHIGPDGKVVEYPAGEYNPYNQAPSQPGYAMDPYRPHSPASEAGKGRDFFGSRSQYEGYPPTSNAGYEYDPYSRGPPPRQEYPYGQVGYSPQSQAGYSGHYRDAAVGGYPQSGYAELDGALLPPNGQDPYRNTPSPGLHGLPQDRYVRWRDPDLHEVIDFLSNPNNVVKANAAAYLQHLCYMDDPTKQKTRILGGIPPLVALLTHDLPELHRNACGALRNLSYGRQNDENKRAIRDASGIPSLVRLLRKTPDNEVKELVTGILWNLSSCEDLKHNIIDDALTVIVSHVIIPCSGWDGGDVERDPNVDVWWSTVFKNASGVLRNISSAGEYARTKLRQCNGLVDSLLTVIKSAIQGSSHDNKSVENCVCILRNLSYRCQEVEDPNYDKNQPPTQSRATATAKDGEGEGTDTCGRSSEPKDNLCDNLGCFGGSRKKKEAVGGAVKETSTGQRTTGPRTEPLRGMELLWQPEVVVSSYLALLSDCSNPETLEAAAGALQNLAACYWQPSIDVRAAVRKEKGLPILVELLRMEVDRVVCAVATALRNLAIDQRNKELIGKYAMRDLVQKLPSGNTHDSGTSDETIAAVLATLNEVIKKSAEFSRSLLDVGGVERLVNMTRHRGRYSVRVVKFASQVLFSMWGHQELREVYKKAGWKEQDFVSKSVAARNAAGGGANSPTANNTLNRPMASQGGTRYEDRTIQRGQGKAHHQYNRGEEVPMANMGYSGDGGVVPPAGGVRLYPPMQGKPGEPVYAKVNRDKKRNRQYDSMGPQYGTLGGADDWGGPVYSGSPAASPNFNNSPSMNNNNSNANNNNNNGILLENAADGQAGDSWV